MSYPGRTFSYKEKFNDSQRKQLAAAQAHGLSCMPADRKEAARMKRQLVLVENTDNYIVDSLTHSIPYLVPKAAAELEAIGDEWADILARNNRRERAQPVKAALERAQRRRASEK